MSLRITNLQVTSGQKPILSGINLEINPGSVHAIMGPNGSGKSTLANTLMGHPEYQVTAGEIMLDGEPITAVSPDKKARLGLFLSPQYPPEIAGVNMAHFLRLALGALYNQPQNPLSFQTELYRQMEALGIEKEFARRPMTGFSGGEKKRLEVLQLAMLNPRYAILDETDSGLDVDALKMVAAGINRFHTAANAVLIITHYNRILQYIKPDYVHIMMGGEIVRSGGVELAEMVEKEGYKKI